MAYIGKTPSQAVRSRYFYTATGGETSLSGADDNGDTLIFADGNYVDVYLNGVLLVASSDYNVNTVNTIAGLTALTASDIVEIVVYDTFSVFGGVFQGDLSADTITGDMFGSHQFEAKNIEGSTIPKGTPVYIAGHSGNDPEIAIADADDPAKMPAFGITTAAIANNTKGNVIVFGNYIGLDTSSFSVGDELYVSNTGTLVNTRPSASADKVQKIAKVIRSQSQNGQIFVMGAGRSNDVPNAITTNSINLSSTTTVDSVLDEDTMTSDSATALATQQSIKAYVDSQIGSNNELSEILTNGNTTGGNDISFDDNDKAVFGAGSDLQIYHDGLNSYITDSGTGNLRIQAQELLIEDPSGNDYFYGISGAQTAMCYAGTAKVQTTSTGVDVTGTVAATSYTGDGSALTGIASDVVNDTTPQLGGNLDTNGNDITFGDNDKAVFGGELQIYSDATHARIVENGTGQLKIQGNNMQLLTSDGVSTYLEGNASTSAVTLYHASNSPRLATTATGVDVTGTVTADGLTVSPSSGAAIGTVEAIAGQSAYVSIRGNNTTFLTDSFDISQLSNGAAEVMQRANYPLVIGTNNAERMRIDSSGNVGIGSPTPSFRLAVEDGTAATRVNVRNNANAAAGSGIFFEVLNGGSTVGNGTIATQGNGDMAFFTGTSSGAERLRIDSSGRVTMPYQPMSSHSTAVGSTADQVLPASSVQVNNGGHLSTSTNSGRFTAPVTGYYKCIFTGFTNYSGGYGYVNLRKNGAQQGYSIHWNHSGYQIHTGVSLNQVVYCSANDYLAFHSFGGSSWIQGGTVTFELIA